MLIKAAKEKNSPLSSAFRRTEMSAVGSMMVAYVDWDGKQICSISTLFIAIFASTGRSEYLFTKLVFNSWNVYYLNTFFDTFHQVIATQCA